jgi:hypothetical protein
METEDKKQADSRYPLRLPPDLYKQIQELAEKNFHSVNAEMVRLLRKAVQMESGPQPPQP